MTEPALASAPARERRAALPLVWSALRPHQWVKNVLLALPLLAAHRLGDRAALLSALLGVAAFSLAASAGYVLNDLADAGSDKAHPRKRRRPFAAGELPREVGFGVAAALVIGSGLVGTVLPLAFGLLLAGYLAVAVGYTFLFRRVPMLDVIVLAGMYTARVFAGGFATGIPVSEWLASFSMFLFLSLAFLKRAAELVEAPQNAAGRGYVAADRETVFAFGAAAGMMSVVVLTLYLSSPEVRRLYSHPGRLWAMCPLLLYWVAHLWMRARRGTVRDDPLVAALGDRVTWVACVLGGIVISLAV